MSFPLPVWFPTSNGQQTDCQKSHRTARRLIEVLSPVGSNLIIWLTLAQTIVSKLDSYDDLSPYVKNNPQVMNVTFTHPMAKQK